MTAETVAILRELRGQKCRCGRRKIEKQTFCGSCYHSLPKDMQRALYRRLNKGYEEAYRVACAHLGLPAPWVEA